MFSSFDRSVETMQSEDRMEAAAVATETTSLLPLTVARGTPRMVLSRSNRARRLLPVILVTVMATLGVFLALQRAGMNTTAASSQWSMNLPRDNNDLAAFDARVDLWEGWKRNAQHWWDSSIAHVGHNNDTLGHANDDDYTSETTSSSLWNATFAKQGLDEFLNGTASNARKFSDHVQSWWTTRNDNNNDTNSNDKVPAIQRSFAEWWLNANDEERSWWNATIRSVQDGLQNSEEWWRSSAAPMLHDKQAQLAATGQNLWNSTSDELGRDKKAVAEMERNVWNGTVGSVRHGETAARDVWDSTEKELTKDEQALAEAERHAWNTSVDALQHGGEATKNLWNATANVVGKGAKAVASSSTGLWNNTAQAYANQYTRGKSASVNAGQHIWNSTMNVIQNGGGAAVATTKSVWNATANELAHDKRSIVNRGHQVWNNTASAVRRGDEAVVSASQKAWNATTNVVANFPNAEQSLWNNTVHAVEGGEDVAASTTQHAWNATVEGVLRSEHAVATAERSLWNSTTHVVENDADAAERMFSLWWNETRRVAQVSWNASTEKEEEWWSATKHWFQNLVHEPNRSIALGNDKSPLLYLNSSRTFYMLINAYHFLDYSADYFLLQRGFDAQINQAYCAVASAAAVMNSFLDTLSLAVDPVYDPYPYSTQRGLMSNSCVDRRVIHSNDTYDGLRHAPGGLSLLQTKMMLECHLPDGWSATEYHVDPNVSNVREVRRHFQEALQNPSKRIIANFDRQELGQEGGGHFSPLGSYSRDDDSFLVLDVAKYKNPPFWVTARVLFAALATKDPCGDWDFPEAQDRLYDETLASPRSLKEFRRATKVLKCRSMNRGYIVVEAPSRVIV
jgi:Phytochelatin synthase